MDNITHSLVGACVAELVLLTGKPDERLRAPLYVTSILGNNLPDLDFAYTFITEGKLGYLLHHRGHTHTLLAAFCMSVLGALGAVGWASRRGIAHKPAARLLLPVGVLGGLLHILCDSANNYGVHPFWPVNNTWYHGDTLFIIEPLLWITLAGVGFCLRSRPMQILLAVVALAGVALPWLAPLPLASRLGAALWAVALGFACHRVRSTGLRLGVIGIGVLALLTANVATRAAARERVLSHVEGQPDLEVSDIVLTPLPAATYCWEVIVVGTEGETFLLRLGQVSLLPSWLPANECPTLRQGYTAPLAATAAASSSSLAWEGEFRMPLSRLRQLAHDCWGHAFLRFARAPFTHEGTIGDLRYDRETGLEFAEMQLPATEACPQRIPPWTPPLEALWSRN